MLNDQGYHVGQVERNLYWVTDGVYQAAFLTTADGVVLFDAPPTIGRNLRGAIDEIAAANGVSNRVTHFVYSHHHHDHGGAASLFDGNIVRIGHEETRRLLARDNDAARPVPDITFADTYTLEVGCERVELAWHGPNHSPDNINIHFPGHDTLMFIDVVNAGWVPIYNVNLSEDVPGYMQAPEIVLSYPWTHFICGHLGRLATRDDVAVHQQYIADIEASAKEALVAVNPSAVLHALRGERVGWREGPPRRRCRTGCRAHHRQVHRRAGRCGRRGVHDHHDVPDHAVAAPRSRAQRAGPPVAAHAGPALTGPAGGGGPPQRPKSDRKRHSSLVQPHAGLQPQHLLATSAPSFASPTP
jgi:glyoxylase-like metal-dependent hydrolase (beta-lactamase superfamily II)